MAGTGQQRWRHGSNSTAVSTCSMTTCGCKWALLAMLAACCVISAAAADVGSMQCEQLMGAYLTKHHKEPTPYTDKSQMVYFLHIPRTAGRTLHTCFLKPGTPPHRRCPKAYDHLRLNMTMPRCNLLSSHDDFSVVSMLPDDVAVVTHLRDPLDRFLSAYEFAIEVGSRALTRSPNFRKRPDRIATEDVWPWSYLVPWFAKDIKQRVAASKEIPQPESGSWVHVTHPDGDQYYYNKALHLSKWNLSTEEQQTLLPPLDAYNNTLVMPLHEFVRHPLASELLHNGQSFQVLGLTNYSHWSDAADLRRCYWSSPQTQARLDAAAQHTVSKFIHVGTTDRLAESVAAAAVALKYDLGGVAYSTMDDTVVSPPAAKSIEQEQAEAAAAAAQSTAADDADLVEKVQKTRAALQHAQQDLFTTAQAQDSSDADIVRKKEAVAALRLDLKASQDALLVARQKLTSTSEPTTTAQQEAVQQAPPPARKLPEPLGVEYQKCARRAQARSLQRRVSSLSHLAMPDSRYVAFSREARKGIPRAVIDAIRELNQGDARLHKQGTDILNSNRVQWAAEGKLQGLLELPAMDRPGMIKTNFKIPKPQTARQQDELRR